ncbi:YicC/YloC family endoribonuclease [Iodobacter sp. CM08]|uniref:YicC/YloC family endoribonuclease n=1 Tax=Iodobacter sp. CM08 TaxID=3085902 RepID=UPI0029820A49|nr:YicC/YloC family endoribonuclease [Iodobacter sp. CM08]MDW5415246.1 YicC/YloC family endoribonuclease [Iodobacter sp. CM08]
MILSMTGFSSIQRELPGGTLSIELRSVNHRFLDLTLRTPEELRPLEGGMRERVAAKLARGKVECRVNWNARVGAEAALQLNTELLQQLLAAAAVAKKIAPQASELQLGELLRWPGVLSAQVAAPESLGAACLEVLDEALFDFSASRGREGEKLKAHLLERIAGMQTIVDEITPLIPQLAAAYEARMKARFLDALGTNDDERVRQEIVIFAQKIDIDEELSRLNAHFSEIRRILEKGGSVGKRLDFLMQELNREANTLGSKSVSAETSRASIELKVLIEQMREQIQNIE